MRRKIAVLSIVAGLLPSLSPAFEPAGWMWFQWPYAYSLNEEAWHYFDEPCSQWCIGMPAGNWQLLSQSAAASGWTYYQWPYGYSMNAGGWLYLDDNSIQYCVDLSTSIWSLFGLPSGLALIPEGPFQMGDAAGDGVANSGEVPVHTVSISAFYMDQCEIPKTTWDAIYQWGIGHGYSFGNAGLAKGIKHPIHSINWYDGVKWCNARSEKEGFQPVYYVGGISATSVYRTGQADLQSADVEWTASGYRLPTEAEWEKAARGGIPGTRFPWSDTNTITQARANYESMWTTNGQPEIPYDVNPTAGYISAYTNGGKPYTSPVGHFDPNGYGLYDMSGNVAEWCWDWYKRGWYTNSSAVVQNTTGPTTGVQHVIRSGAWDASAYYTRCSCRSSLPPDLSLYDMGFRTVRRTTP